MNEMVDTAFPRVLYSKVRLFNNDPDQTEVEIIRQWDDNVCRSTLVNNSSEPRIIKEVVLFYDKIPFESNTPIYGEGYNKLSQYGGTIGDFKSIGSFDEIKHYKLPQTKGFNTVYNMLMFFPENQDALLMGFASCNRFGGQFRFNKNEIEIVLDCEGIKILPGETIELEVFFVAIGERQQLLNQYAKEIQRNHTMLTIGEIPTGWCSWLVYGPDVTAQNIYDNMDTIKKEIPGLKYIQIDDGYQAHMGDWLSTTYAFEGGVEKLCMNIKEQGFEPAIWVAPFIAERDSELFKNHPEWFIKDESGDPLPSDNVTFGGWRCAPWYMLDGTHPGAREYLRYVFKTMREKWKVKYYKLDANMWGAMPFGMHYEANKTCIEAYRMGMKAILEGAGEDSFILGCNAPMWPSLGLVHGMRITNDNARRWEVIRALPKECFPRNWQNNRLWVIDPDTVLLENKNTKVMGPDGSEVILSGRVTRDEFMFNAAYVLASGGMVLSGDDMTVLLEDNKKIIQKLLPPIGEAAIFDNTDYKVGRIKLDNGVIICVFNYDDKPCDMEIKIDGFCTVADFWTDEEFGLFTEVISICSMSPHSAKVFRIMGTKSSGSMESGNWRANRENSSRFC